MKKIKFKIIAALFFVALNSYGQAIVNDPKAMAEAIKNGKEIARQTELATKALEKLEQVNSLLQNAKLIMAIKNNITATSQMLEETPRLIGKIRLEALRREYLKEGAALMVDTSILQELIMATIKPKSLSMTDGERLKTLMDLYNESKAIRSKVGMYKYSIINLN